MRAPTDVTVEQMKQAYRRMVEEEVYNPIFPPEDDHNFDSASVYAEEWWKEEQAMFYALGCPNWSDRPALIFLVEAGRNLCAMRHGTAIDLLEMALENLRKLEADPLYENVAADLAHPNFHR